MNEANQTTETKSETKAPPASCVKFSADEFSKIKADSQLTGKSIPSLLKAAYFSGRRATLLMSKSDQEQWFKELRHWGNNLNQIAKRVNSGLMDGWYEDFELVRKGLKAIENMVLGVYGSRHI